MDTKGHWECARDAGQPQLKGALDGLNLGAWRLKAFYLGNWLTDVSQVVDPVSLATARVKFRAAWNFIEFAVKSLASTSDFFTPLSERLREERVKTEAALKRLSEEGVLAENAKAIFFILGYKKFVYPKAARTGKRRGLERWTTLLTNTLSGISRPGRGSIQNTADSPNTIRTSIWIAIPWSRARERSFRRRWRRERGRRRGGEPAGI